MLRVNPKPGFGVDSSIVVVRNPDEEEVVVVGQASILGFGLRV